MEGPTFQHSCSNIWVTAPPLFLCSNDYVPAQTRCSVEMWVGLLLTTLHSVL